MQPRCKHPACAPWLSKNPTPPSGLPAINSAGGTDASQSKDAVLVFLFLKSVSDKDAGKLFAPLTIPS
ncbi:hypothetical protein [Haloferula sargassicola]